MSLNLLPPQEIKTLKYLFLKRCANTVVVLIILAELFLVLILAGIQIILSKQYEKEKQNVEIQSKSVELEEIKKSEQKINNFNNYLTRLGNIQKNHINWTEIVNIINKNQLPEIKLDSITVSDESKKMTLKGTAQTREAFLQFKDRLEKTEYFSDFNSPFNNVINPTNIIFSLDFTVKAEKIKQLQQPDNQP